MSEPSVTCHNDPPQDVMNLIVVNESKLRRAPVVPKLPLIEAQASRSGIPVPSLPRQPAC